MELCTVKSPALKRGASVSDTEFRDLAGGIYSLLGIASPEKRGCLLENRLRCRLETLSLDSFGEYLEYLKHGAGGKAEIDELIRRVTTNETSFFRDQVPMRCFQKSLLAPFLAEREKKGVREVHIWSAGCSSGDEPYTLGILLADLLGARRSDWRINILATDVSTSVLEYARRGVYGHHALRTAPPELVARYFDEDGPRYAIKPEIRMLVRFERLNLTDMAAMKGVPCSDFIFCCNVNIYLVRT